MFQLSLNLPTAQVSPVKEAVEETKTSPTPSRPYSQDGQMMRMFEIAEDHSKVKITSIPVLLLLLSPSPSPSRSLLVHFFLAIVA